MIPVREIASMLSNDVRIYLYFYFADPGDRYPFLIKAQSNQNVTTDEKLRKIKIRFASTETYLESVWIGLPGVITEEYILNLQNHKGKK